MSQPTVRQVHPVDAILTQISVAYRQQLDHFISSRVFPNVMVAKSSGKYVTYTKADWLRDEAKMRADSAESAGSGYPMSTDSYDCNVWALHKDIGDLVQANADSPINPVQDAAQFVIQRMMVQKEVQFATDYMATSIWDTDKTVTTKWSAAGSDPIGDIETGRETILASTGFLPNTLVLGYKTYKVLKHHSDIVDRIKYTGGLAEQMRTEVILATLFDLSNVYVAKAIKNTGKEGGDSTIAQVNTTDVALLCYVAPSPSPLTPSAGYTFTWAGVSDGLGTDIGTVSFNMPELGRNHVRVESQMAYDHKVVATDLGYFFTDVVD